MFTVGEGVVKHGSSKEKNQYIQAQHASCA